MIETLKTQLTTPALVDRFQATFTKAFNQANGGDAARERKEMEKELATAENRVKNVTAALAKIGFSEALAAQLAEEEKRVSDAKARLARAGAHTSKVLPHPRRIESYIRNLLAVLETDKDAARTLLARHVPPLVLTPDASSYRITGGFDLSLCLDEAGAPDPQGVRGAEESMIGRLAGACYRIIQRPGGFQWNSSLLSDLPGSATEFRVERDPDVATGNPRALFCWRPL